MTRLAVIVLVFAPVAANANLIEVTVEADVTEVTAAADLPVRTSLRPGVTTILIYSYQENIVDQGLLYADTAIYKLKEPVHWYGGDYHHETAGQLEQKSNQYRLTAARTQMTGELHPVLGRQLDAAVDMLIVPVPSTPGILPLDPPTINSETDSRYVNVSLTMPIGFTTTTSSVKTEIRSIVSARYVAGDADRSGQVTQMDLVTVLQSNKYLTGEPALWGEGDWTGDGLFDQRDIIAALPNWGGGAYAAVPVPEPAAIWLACIAVITLGARCGFGCGRRAR